MLTPLALLRERGQMNLSHEIYRLDLQELTPSDAYGWRAVARNVLPLFGLLLVAPMIASRSLAAAWSLAPLIGLFMYRITIVMHDCTHATLFSTHPFNHRIGLVLGAITGIDFTRFKLQHWKHHRSYGRDDDPQGFHYMHLPRMNRLQFSWHVIKPLFGANLRFVWRESVVVPRNFRRAVKQGDAAMILVVQLSMFMIVTGGGRHLALALLPIASAATFGLFLSQLRGIAEHDPRGDRNAPAGAVRSHRARLLERLLLYDLHFNYHAAHHRWPQCPSRHLPFVHDQYLATCGPLDRSMFHTVIALGEKCSR